MNFFGRIVEDLTDVWEEVHASRHSADTRELLNALDRAMAAAAKAERQMTNATRAAERLTYDVPTRLAA